MEVANLQLEVKGIVADMQECERKIEKYKNTAKRIYNTKRKLEEDIEDENRKKAEAKAEEEINAIKAKCEQEKEKASNAKKQKLMEMDKVIKECV